MAKRKPKNHYGEGSIFYSNVKQKWMAQINVGKDENGKVIRKSVTAETQEEVKAKLDELKLSIYTGKFVKLDSIGLTQEYFANAFPTAESARMHAELQENFPTMRLIATFAAGFIYLVGLHIFALLWYFLTNKLLLKRLSFQVSHYPHIEDGKIIL